MKTVKNLVTCTIVVMLPIMIIGRIYGVPESHGQLETNSSDFPPGPHPIMTLDIYTQKDGKGSGSFGGTFEPNENVTLYVEVKKDGVPVNDQLVAFEIVGPVNAYQNISALLKTTTNSSGIGSAVFTVPLPSEHADEIILGNWTVESRICLDINTVGDTMEFEVFSILPEFPTLTGLLLASVLISAALVVFRQKKHL